MSNIKIGSKWERDFCELLASHGFWVHRIRATEGGQQPADVIAVRGRYHALIDCKSVTTSRGFDLRRMEENQRNAMRLFAERGHEDGWFALRFDDGSIKMLSAWTANCLEDQGVKSVKQTDDQHLWTFEAWLERAISWT